MKNQIITLYVLIFILVAFLCATISRVEDLERLVVLQQNNTDALIGIVKTQVKNTDTLMRTVGSQSLQPSR